jgi:hypothetical protein
VRGQSFAVSGAARGVLGQVASPDGTGVTGFNGPAASLPPPLARTGVYGFSATGTTAFGVVGQSTNGQGVRGVVTSGIGVRGVASTTGTGGRFDSASGLALHTVGRLRLEKAVGIASIASGTKTVTVTPGTDLTATTVVLATLRGDPGGTTAVQRVAIDTVANTFSIILTANATSAVAVSWFAANAGA